MALEDMPNAGGLESSLRGQIEQTEGVFRLQDPIDKEAFDADAYGARLLGGPGLPINPLSVASVNELIDELRLRFDCVVVIGQSRSKTEDESRLKVNYFGGFYTCMGMLHATMHDMEHSQSQEDDTEDYDG